jgi:hypothetical protein
MSKASKTSQTLSAVTATGAGTTVDTSKLSRFAMFVVASAVTSGGTVKVEALSPDGTTWALVPNATITVTANGTTCVAFEGPWTSLRANLTARTDGTFSAWIVSAV